MLTITGIVPSARRSGRFELMVDGKAVAVLSLESVERMRLRVGGVYDERVAVVVEEEARALHTFDRALALLAVRGRSARELQRALLRKGELERDVDAAIARALALGVLDDAAYARQFVRAKIAGPGFSRWRLRSELARRGVARAVVDAAIADVLTDEAVDEEAVIERVAVKKLRALARLDPAVRRRRLYAFLARRGYEADEIRRVLAALGDRIEGGGEELGEAGADEAEEAEEAERGARRDD